MENIENNTGIIKEKNDNKKEVLFYTDVISAFVVAVLAFCTRFVSWYGFFIGENAKSHLYRRFGPYGGIGFSNGEEIGFDRLSSRLETAKVLLTVCAVLFALYIIVLVLQVTLPKIRNSFIPFVSGVLFYGTLLAAVVYGFLGAVGSAELYSNVESTVGIGWYAALVLSLIGLALTAAPTLVSNTIGKYLEDNR
ncbi:MAG: hypothetical protein E7597_03050 [Ruminococcaceae bacterium]|nr:hypothetical protein [Oscillospiraceae bacterium]